MSAYCSGEVVLVMTCELLPKPFLHLCYDFVQGCSTICAFSAEAAATVSSRNSMILTTFIRSCFELQDSKPLALLSL